MTKQKIKNPVEDYLYQAWYIDVNVASCINELNDIRIKAYSAPTANYAAIISFGGDNHSRTEGNALKVSQYEEKVKSIMEQYASLKKEIQEKIERVKDMRERTVLRLRFIERLSFRDIGIAMSYSKSQVYDIYDRAIKNVEIS